MEDVTTVETSVTEMAEVSSNEEAVVLDAATVDVEDMNDDELDEFLDATTPDGDNGTDTKADRVEVSISDRYRTQLDNTEAKLEQPVLIKVDGEVLELNSINELRDMAERGTSVTKKFQKLADDRRQLEAQLRELNVEPDVVDDEVSAVENTAQEILASSYAETFKSDVSSLDADVKAELSSNAQMLKGLSLDYQSGLAQKIMPQVKREMTVKGMNFIQAYVSVGQAVNKQSQQVEATRNTLASQPKQNTNPQSSTQVSIDSMSDSEFDKYFSNI